MEVSENIGVKEYFEEVVPKMVEEQLAGSAITGMDGTVFTVEFDVKGDREYVYGITVKDAKDLAVSEGALESPMIKVEVSEDVWRKAVTGKLEGAMDMFMDMGQIIEEDVPDVLFSNPSHERTKLFLSKIL